MQASPTKLRSGAWGARVQSTSVRTGDTITIKTKAGKSWPAVVDRIVWSGSGVSIVATRGAGAGATRGTATRGGCRGCGGPVVDVAHHRAMNGYCGGCAFDEFDC